MSLAADLRKQAANKYPATVQALLAGENPFPLSLRYRRIRTTAPRAEILQTIENLRAESTETRRHGITIEWQEIDTARYGRNRIPGNLSFATEDDYLHYIGKAEEMRVIRRAAETLRAAFPELDPVLPHHWRLLCAGDAAYWDGVCHLLRYFRQNPFPDCFARELPVPVPTKFLATARAPLENLLPHIAPKSLRAEGSSLEERLGLRTPDSLIECRLLDPQVAPGLPFRHLIIPVSDLAHLATLPVDKVLITENRINFLTLPPLPGTLALQGQGYAVSRLRRAPFLHERRLLYWGDLDVHGFEILATLRRAFPHTESLLMDAATWEAHAPFHQTGAPAGRHTAATLAPHLTPAEQALHATLAENRLRLEQEHIPLPYANATLRQMIAG
ncbi:MAG: DUF2399 domain-containing protein [Opitutales bacterium]|nr:DUF2399 domain-containing protein [Opitutales bacterium]